MSIPSVFEILSRFLFNSPEPPEDLKKDDFIRDQTARGTEVTVNVFEAYSDAYSPLGEGNDEPVENPGWGDIQIPDLSDDAAALAPAELVANPNYDPGAYWAHPIPIDVFA